MTKENDMSTEKPVIDIANIKIGHGGHDRPKTIDDDTKVCALEWVSLLAKESVENWHWDTGTATS